MKNKSYIHEETQVDKILFHGSPYVFEKFEDRMTFFSEHPQFAIDYSDQKSFEGAMDREPNLYTVKLNTNLFNPKNESHQKQILSILPDEVEFAYNNFGFTTKQPKEKVVGWMTGHDIEEPNEEAIKAKVGDKIVDPTYSRDTLTVVKKDKDYAYTVNSKRLYSISEGLLKDYFDVHFDSNYVKMWQPLKDFAKEVFRLREPQEYFSTWALSIVVSSLMGKDTPSYMSFETTSEEQAKFQKMYNDIWKDILKSISEEPHLTKWVLKPTPYEMEDTWRFFENDDVISAIQKLGYGGYVAKERKHNTYAIFHPNRDVVIIQYQIPVGRPFKTWDELQNYKKYNYNFGMLYHKKYGKYPWSSDIYQSWSLGKSVEDGVEHVYKIDSKNNLNEVRKKIRNQLFDILNEKLINL